MNIQLFASHTNTIVQQSFLHQYNHIHKIIFIQKGGTNFKSPEHPEWDLILRPQSLVTSSLDHYAIKYLSLFIQLKDGINQGILIPAISLLTFHEDFQPVGRLATFPGMTVIVFQSIDLQHQLPL